MTIEELKSMLSRLSAGKMASKNHLAVVQQQFHTPPTNPTETDTHVCLRGVCLEKICGCDCGLMVRIPIRLIGLAH